MAFLAPAVPWIMGAVAVVSAWSTYQQGQAADDASKIMAEQLRQKANDERGAAALRAERERRELRYLQSRAQAVAAASGGGATDPSVLSIMGRNEMEGERNALAELWQGEQAARQYEYEARVARYEGKSAKQQATLKAATDLGMAALSMYGKYGGGGASASKSKSLTVSRSGTADFGYGTVSRSRKLTIDWSGI